MRNTFQCPQCGQEVRRYVQPDAMKRGKYKCRHRQHTQQLFRRYGETIWFCSLRCKEQYIYDLQAESF